MPTTLPSMFTSGPPELPVWIGALTWNTRGSLLAPEKLLTMPSVTFGSMPCRLTLGKPMVTIAEPRRTSAEGATGNGLKRPSALRIARSLTRSVATTRASMVSPLRLRSRTAPLPTTT